MLDNDSDQSDNGRSQGAAKGQDELPSLPNPPEFTRGSIQPRGTVQRHSNLTVLFSILNPLTPMLAAAGLLTDFTVKCQIILLIKGKPHNSKTS